MKIARSILLIATAVAGLAGASVSLGAQRAVPQSLMPDALVRDLYKKQGEKHGPFFQTRSRALVDRYFAKELADMIWKDAISSKGEVGALDGDPLYDAQEMEIKDFSIHPAKYDGEKAEVTVTFLNLGEKKQFVFELRKQGPSWKITNIQYEKGRSLVDSFKDSGT